MLAEVRPTQSRCCTHTTCFSLLLCFAIRTTTIYFSKLLCHDQIAKRCVPLSHVLQPPPPHRPALAPVVMQHHLPQPSPLIGVGPAAAAAKAMAGRVRSHAGGAATACAWRSMAAARGLRTMACAPPSVATVSCSIASSTLPLWSICGWCRSRSVLTRGSVHISCSSVRVGTQLLLMCCVCEVVSQHQFGGALSGDSCVDVHTVCSQ